MNSIGQLVQVLEILPVNFVSVGGPSGFREGSLEVPIQTRSTSDELEGGMVVVRDSSTCGKEGRMLETICGIWQ